MKLTPSCRMLSTYEPRSSHTMNVLTISSRSAHRARLPSSRSGLTRGRGMLTIEVAYPKGIRFLSLPTALACQNRRTAADSLGGQAFPAPESGELQQYADVHQFRAKPFQQGRRGRDGAARGKHIVHDEYARP